MEIIDAHLHLINLEEGDYHWIKTVNGQGKEDLNASFYERDLHIDTPFSLAGFVHVEAGFDNNRPWREVEWLEKHCSIPFRSIAFADLTEDFSTVWKRLAQSSCVVGIRNILGDKACDVLSLEQTYLHLLQLSDHEKIFEIGFDINNTACTQALCDLMLRLPELTVVIDHAGLYVDQVGGLNNLTMLADQKNCYIKCSGWEMAEVDQDTVNFSVIVNRIKRLLALFGQNRVMLGSNFPLCLLKQSYQECWEQNRRLLTEGILSQAVWEKLSFLNAHRIFRFHL